MEAVFNDVEGVEMVVTEGDSVTLTCSPPAITTVVINNVTSGDNMFASTNISRDDAGFYQCLPTAGRVGPGDSLYLLVTCE